MSQTVVTGGERAAERPDGHTVEAGVRGSAMPFRSELYVNVCVRACKGGHRVHGAQGRARRVSIGRFGSGCARIILLFPLVVSVCPLPVRRRARAVASRARLFDEALVYLGIEPGKNGFFIYTLGMPTHYQDRQRPYVHNVVRVHQAASLAFCTTPSNFFASVSPSCKKPHPHEMPVAGRPAATRSSGVMDAIFSCRCR